MVEVKEELQSHSDRTKAQLDTLKEEEGGEEIRVSFLFEVSHCARKGKKKTMSIGRMERKRRKSSRSNLDENCIVGSDIDLKGCAARNEGEKRGYFCDVEKRNTGIEETEIAGHVRAAYRDKRSL